MQHTAWFRFYEELNDFLPVERRGVTFPYSYSGTPAVKDAIEAMGIPHPEVDLIIVNGISVGFDHLLQPQDRISVYPVFESLDISPLVRLRQRPLRRTAFIADVHLGKLARLLRLLGFDTRYRNDYEDAEIVRISLDEHRIILTRDRGLLKIGIVTHGYWIRSLIPEEQLKEVLDRFDLRSSIQPLGRCLRCNDMIERIQKADISHRLLPGTARYYEEFARCCGCGRIYWRGSHWKRLAGRLRALGLDVEDARRNPLQKQ